MSFAWVKVPIVSEEICATTDPITVVVVVSFGAVLTFSFFQHSHAITPAEILGNGTAAHAYSGYAHQFFSTAAKNGDVSWTGMWRHL